MDVLRGVTLTIPVGKVTAIVGRSSRVTFELVVRPSELRL